MKMLIGQALVALGFILGTLYTQSQVVLPLHQDIKIERDRNAVLERALDIVTQNKFKKRDAIWMAIQEANRGR